MAKGQESKAYVENKIREAFGKDFIGVDTATKKIYVNGYEDGQPMQVCISMTCPKTPFAIPGAETEFSAGGNFGEPDVYQPAEITSDELENVRKMMRELGI